VRKRARNSCVRIRSVLKTLLHKGQRRELEGKGNTKCINVPVPDYEEIEKIIEEKESVVGQCTSLQLERSTKKNKKWIRREKGDRQLTKLCNKYEKPLRSNLGGEEGSSDPDREKRSTWDDDKTNVRLLQKDIR